MPRTLWAGLDALEAGSVMKDYLTERYVEAYVGVKRAELASFFAEPLIREYEWYL